MLTWSSPGFKLYDLGGFHHVFLMLLLIRLRPDDGL